MNNSSTTIVDAKRSITTTHDHINNATTNISRRTKSLQTLILCSILISSLFIPIGHTDSATKWPQHRHRHNRLGRSFADSPMSIGRRRRLHSPTFPTLATPVDFQFTAPFYNLTVHENSIGQRAVAASPESPQLVGVWLPRGYHQISFRIVEGDKQGRFAVSAKKLGNFAFLQLEHRDQMDVLNRELQAEFRFTIKAIAKRKKANTMEASTTVHLRVLDENDNPPMFKELAYRVELDSDVPVHSRLIRLEAFDADEGLNGALYYSLLDPSPFFYIDPSTGWLRTFARLDSSPLPPPSNLTLHVRIEDRASRLFFRSRQKTTEGDNGPAVVPLQFIRNRAKVEVVVRHKEPEKPQLTFQLLPFAPIFSDPARVGIVRIGGTDPDGVHLDIASRHNSPNVSNCAWMERKSAEEVELWICGPFPVSDYKEKLEVRVAISRIVDKSTGRRVQLGEEMLELRADPSRRKIKVQEVPGGIDIVESVPVRALLWQFKAVSSWPIDQKLIRFRLQKHAYTEFPFELGQQSGQLRLRAPLDFEQSKIRQWNITVVAQLDTEQSQTQVQLRLHDINDNCPEFAQIPLGHRITLTETQLDPKTPSDAIVWRAKATDKDGGANGEVVYKLVEEDKLGMFSIDALTGEIHLTGNWSSSSSNGPDQLRIRILAMDRGWPLSLQTQLRLIVQRNTKMNNTLDSVAGSDWLQNVCQMDNRHVPEFVSKSNNEDRWLVGEVQETAAEGTIIGQVLAEDKDRVGPNGFVQYWVEPNSDGEAHFGVEQFSGKLFLRKSTVEILEGAKNHDGGAQQDYHEQVLTIVASDMALRNSDRKNVSQEFRIRIFGANTHSPVFEQPGYRVHIPEGNSPGIELLQLRARDDDLGRNGRVEFRLAVETDLVSVDPDSGLVRAERVLDREELGDQITLLVMALDRGSPSRATFANLTILLSDVNDEKPRCGREMHRFSIPKDVPNGQLIGCVSAFDRDLAGTPNSQIHFRLVSNNSTNSPPAAADHLPFRIHSETGCLFFSELAEHPLDFEQLSIYNLSVRLRDQGKPLLESAEICQIQVLLEDVDENVLPPQFSDTAMEASVEENAPAGTEVMRVQAEDPEGTRVRYRMVGGSGLGWFRIDPDSGTIRTTKEIDYEQHQQFWLTVQAEDSPPSGSRTLRAHLHVFVRILNRNDRLPLFSQPFYRVAIAENSEENKVVLKVEATDADDQWTKPKNEQNDRLKYSILRGNPQSHFQIDEHTGYLVTGKRRLDREAQSEHELVVQACDQGQLCSTATVLVIVEDLNDNAPVFDTQQLRQMAIPGDRKGPIGMVFAADQDAPGSANSRISRYWLGDNADPRLKMDETGRLFVQEALKAGTELSEATVWAEDGGNPAMRANATLRLAVIGRTGRLRASNRSPRLLGRDEWKEMEVAEGAQTGTTVGTAMVRAEDPDGDTLWWTVTEVEAEREQKEPFAFRRVEGGAELVVAEQLGSHVAGQQQGVVVVHFSVSDGMDTINDQLIVRVRPHSSAKPRPKFEHSETTIELSNQIPVGLVLHQAKAKVGEQEEFGGLSHPQRIQYSLHSVDDVAAREVFRVEPATGNVLLERQLPESLASPFALILSASFSGSADVAGFAVLWMKRRAENEQGPEFVGLEGERQQMVVKMDLDLERIGPGALIHTVEAIDPDTGELGGVSYSIMAGNEQKLFSLNANSGELTLAKPIPANFNETILTVRATDMPPVGQQPKWTKCQLRIRANARKYILRREFGESEVALGGVGPDQKRAEMPNTFLLASSPLHPSSTFFALSNSQNECTQMLSIHFATGRITLIRDTVTEETVLNCTVELRRTGEGEDEEMVLEQMHLPIRILPTISTSLRFNRHEFDGEIEENAAPGSVVQLSNSSSPLQLALSSPQIPNIKFRLLSPLDTHFMVDPQSGLVRCLAPIDFEQFPQWHFFVLAQQSLPSPIGFTQPALVKIRIKNIDDEGPAFGSNSVQLRIILPTINESAIGSLDASDADSDQLTYSIKDPSNLFAIENHRGTISSIGNGSELLALGRSSIQIEAIVSDGPRVSKPLGIRIQWSNSTELPFEFTQPVYNLNLRENQTERTLLLSLWPPKVPLGEPIRFELLAPNEAQWATAFEMETLTGLLWLDTRKYQLDRELDPKLQFLVKANGEKGTLAQSLLNIHLEDINDCEPEFAQTEYSASISEAAKTGDRIMTVRARDNDTGMNAVVRYSLSTDAPPFVELNKYDGKMTVSAAIGAERKLNIGQMFQFQVWAIDRGVPPLSSSVPVTLRVVHRLQPIFSQQSYTVTVHSDAKNPLVTVRAWGNAPSSRIGYRITEGDHRRQFRLDFDKGQLHLANPSELSAMESEYNLTVEATDITRQSAPPARAQIHLRFLRPLSDSGPIRFLQPLFRWEIPENTMGRHQFPITPNNAKNVSIRLFPESFDGFQFPPVSIHRQHNGADQLIIDPLDFELCPFLQFGAQLHHFAGNSDTLVEKALVQLTVSDVNDNTPEFVENGPVEITVKWPTFITAESESTTPPQFLHKFRAIDRDTVFGWPLAGNKQLEYRIVHGSIGGSSAVPPFIQLDPSTGVLSADWSLINRSGHFWSMPPDHPLSLNISVNDGLHSSLLGVKLRFVRDNSDDINDPSSSLQFDQSSYSARVAKTASRGMPLGTLRVHGGTPPYKFSIGTKLLMDNPIELDRDSGRVVLASGATETGGRNEIMQSWHPIPVVVEDAHGRKAYSQFQLVPLEIGDDNVHTPRWIAPKDGYKIALDLGAILPEEPLLQVLAVDEDRGDRLEYQMAGTADADRLFQLNSTTGVLSLRKMEGDTLASVTRARLLSFSIRVSDAGNPPHQSEIPVQLRLLPPSSKAPPFSQVPRFGQLRYFFALPEDTPTGQQISQLQSAGNADTVGIFGANVRFSIVESSGPTDSAPFSLDPQTGQLSLRRQLDAEQQQSHHFVVRLSRQSDATDDPDPPGSLALVSVSVIDVNDSPPKFVSAPLEEPIVVKESASPGTVAASFVAWDQDIEEANSAIAYSLETDVDDPDAQVDWTVDSEQGWLRVGPGGLDRERRSFYELRIIATDPGGLRADQPVRVRVADVNDSPPRFDQNLYILHLNLDRSTTMINQTLLRFGVSDPDEAKSDEELRIILLDDQMGLFRVGKGYSLILARMPTKREVDALQQPYTVRVAVSDGFHSAYAQLQTIIHLNSSDQHSPTSPDRNCTNFGDQKLKIAGNLPPGHPIYEWSHNEVLVELFGTEDIQKSFQLRNQSTLVTLADYHRSPQYTIRALIREKRFGNAFFGCQQTADCVQSLQIQVENANRMAPKFPSRELVLNVSEHAFKRKADESDGDQAMVVLARLEAIDTDWGQFGQLRYSIVDEQGAKPFRVDPDTGVLTLVGELDREQRERWEMEVRVQDGGGLRGSMRVQVQVQDENDNAPECAQPIVQAQLLENDPNGLDLQLEAVDRDLLRHPEGFLFQLSAETPPELARVLRVSPAGKIQLAPDTSLDFEQWKTTKRNGPAALIEFSVEVHDRGEPLSLKGLCRVQLILLDLNDNAPVFEQPIYEVEMRENVPEGTKLLKLVAKDADSEHFGRVSYSLETAQLVQLQADNHTELLGPMLNQSDLMEHFALGDQDGWLKVARPLDFEQIGDDRLIQLRVQAQDGGDPPLSGHALVQLRVLDHNDNPPRIADCAKMSAVVQEGVAPGHSLLSLSISDSDSATNGNAGPFRVQINGPGADAFAVDPLLNVITTRQLTFAQNREFKLELHAFDAGGLSSEPCLLRIRVQPQSRHAPDVRPLSVQLMALHGEYLGGPIGKVIATDGDPSDQLRFAIVASDQHRSAPQFSINPESGELFAPGDLLPGFHRFNVSVTDGKFVSMAPISVNLVKVDQERLDNSLSIRLRGADIPHFVHSFMRRFTELLARLLAVRPTNVYILAMQSSQIAPTNSAKTSNEFTSLSGPTISSGIRRRRRRHRGRTNRSSPIQKLALAPKEANSVVDILLAIQRPDGTAGGVLYHRPSYVKQRLEAGMGPLFARETPELEVLSITTEVCRRDSCPRGECRDRLWLDNANPQLVQLDGSGTVFLGPQHVRTFECICRQGYAGPNCDVPVNKCSKELCKRTELCIPSPSSSLGFSCACTPGFRGTSCSERICTNESPAQLTECQRQSEAISLRGDGYLELRLATSVESRMELSVEFRTVSAHSVLMHGKGLHDFHSLRINDGMIHYVWNCGTGEGSVRVTAIRVDDGQWHQIRILRIGRLSRLTLDDKHRAEGTSPPGSDVLNLFLHSALLLFGASVDFSLASLRQFSEAFSANKLGGSKPMTAEELRVVVAEGMVGCIGRVALDGVALARTGAGLRLFGATIGCDERALGPCLNAPCQNGAQCIPLSSSSSTSSSSSSLSTNSSSSSSSAMFTCNCPQRFTGSRCEIDLNVCASHPCPNGIPCHNLYGDFHCSCPTGFTGKTCQLRGDWDPCVTASCGPNGQCVRLPGNSFTCLCVNGFKGPQCSDSAIPTDLTETDDEVRSRSDWLGELVGSPQFALFLLICLLSLFFTILGVFICRWRNSQHRQQNDSERRRNRRKEAKRANGTGSGGRRNGHGSGSGNGNPNSASRREYQLASSPLVPKETAAPGQGTADRPPPPLPPRYHRRNANGHSAALPTVEVRPMPASEKAPKGQLDQQPIKAPPLPPPRDSSSEQQMCANDTALRAFGRRLEPEELRRYSLDRGSAEQNSSMASPSAELQQGQSEQRHNGSYGRKIDQACSVAANTQRQKMTKKGIVGTKEGEDNNYLTMKPIHRAKPFRLASKTRTEEGENAPPPPLHRTPLLNARNPAKTYESPTDALEEEDGERGRGKAK